VRSSTRDKQPVGRCGTGKWFEQTQFTIIRVRPVDLGCYRWDGVPVLGSDYQALAGGLSILQQALPQVPPVPLVPPVPPASE